MYHIVYCPKYSYKILQDDAAKYVTRQVYRLSDRKDGVEVLEVNVQVDHVHMVEKILPKYSVSQYMGFLKGKLALRMFDRFPEMRKRYWGQHVRSRGYYLSTVGLNEDRIPNMSNGRPRRNKKLKRSMDVCLKVE